MVCVLQLGFAQVSLTIDPPESHIGYHETVTLSVNISGVEETDPMRGFEMTVNYDPTYLTITAEDFTEGTFLSDAATPEFATQFYAIGMEGAITVSCAILGVPPDHQPPSPWGAFGDGTLFTMSFTALQKPSCYTAIPITLTDIILRNEVNQPIVPSSVTGADIYVHPTLIIPLHTGWNLISSWVIPPDMSMDSVFAALREDGYLIKVQDEYGNAYVQDVLGNWQNAIGDYEMDEGYYVRVNAECDLIIEGACIILPMVVDLHTGWNIIPYPYPLPQTALSILEPIINSGILIKAQDEYGDAIVQNIQGEWVDDIGDFEEGEGYYINVTGPASITYPVWNGATQNSIDINHHDSNLDYNVNTIK